MEWQEQEGGRVEEAQQGEFVVRGILLGQESVLGAVSFGPKRKSPPTRLPLLDSRTKIISVSTAANSAGSTENSDFQTLQELSDSIVTIITALENLVDSFVCSVTATSKKGSQ